MPDPPGRKENLYNHFKQVEGATHWLQNQKTLEVLQFSLFLMILRVGRDRRQPHGRAMGEEASLQQPVLENQRLNLPSKSRPKHLPSPDPSPPGGHSPPAPSRRRGPPLAAPGEAFGRGGTGWGRAGPGAEGDAAILPAPPLRGKAVFKGRAGDPVGAPSCPPPRRAPWCQFCTKGCSLLGTDGDPSARQLPSPPLRRPHSPARVVCRPVPPPRGPPRRLPGLRAAKGYARRCRSAPSTWRGRERGDGAEFH